MPKYKRRVMAWGFVNSRETLQGWCAPTKKDANDCILSSKKEKVVRVWIERVDKRRQR